MRFRPAAQADAHRIAELHAQNWRVHHRGFHSEEYLEHHLLEERRRVWLGRLLAPAPNQFVVLAETAGALAGFACAFGADDATWGSLLDNLHVRAEDQGKGVGTALIGEVSAWCRDCYPGSGLYLWVLEQNERARAFYRHLGAREEDRQIFAAPEGAPMHVRRYVWASPPNIARGQTRGAPCAGR
jgi:GNAT superfamily N-acetyltransferase